MQEIIERSLMNLEVKNKIFTVSMVDFQDDGTSEVKLIPSTTSLVNGDQVVAKDGIKLKGKTYWFNGTNWVVGQQKTLVNQEPLFDIFDNNGKSYTNKTTYQSSNFAGTPLFAYGKGSGTTLDPELGINLKYKNFSNIGDIVFDNKYSLDTFTHTATTGSSTLNVSTGFIKVTDSNKTVSYIDGWEKIDTPSVQYQVVTYVANGTAKQFEIGVAPIVGTLPGTIVFTDSTEIKTGWEYKLDSGRHIVEFTTAPAVSTQITIKVK